MGRNSFKKFCKYTKNFTMMKCSLIKNYLKLIDVIFILLCISILITLFFTKFYYPFNRYIGYSQEARAMISNDIPLFVYTLLFSLTIGLIFTFWLYISPEKIRLIIPMFGFILWLQGPFSQNIFYSTDSLYHVGVIARLSDLSLIPLEKIVHYTGLIFHRFFSVLSLPFTAYYTILYLAPILMFPFYIPLGDKLIRYFDNWKAKVLVGFVYYSFPIVFTQKFASTPYSFLIALVSFFLYFVPFDSRNKKIAGFVISLLCFLTHIHGLIVLLIFLITIITNSIKKSEKFKMVLNFSLFSLILVPFIIIVLTKDSIIQYIISNFSGWSNYNLIIGIIETIAQNIGILTDKFIPKFLEGGIFAVWYAIQLLIYIILVGIGIFFVIKLFRSKSKENSSKEEENAKEENYFKKKAILNHYSIIILQFSVLILFGLFYSFKIQFFRLQYFTLLLGPFLIIYLFRNLIAKINKKAIIVFIFIFLSASPLVIYSQYTPYQESEFELIDWINNYSDESNEKVVVLTHRHLYKLIWALANSSIVVEYWATNFWEQELHENEIFDMRDEENLALVPYNLLISFSSRIIAHEYQFNVQNITLRIEDIKPYFNYTFYNFKDIYIYEFEIRNE